MNEPLLVGITGGIGGGKSTLSAVLREKGYYVFDTDIEAKKLQDSDETLRRTLIHLFGREIYTPEGLDRKKLASVVFSNSEKLLQLNKAVHPAVRKRFEEWKIEHQNEKFLFIESAIMFESGLYRMVDKIVVVTASEKVRIGRVMKRDGISEQEVRSRIQRQMPDEKKIEQADIALNSEGKDILTRNVHKLLEELNKFTTER